ncbi:MAG: MFS transporter, partial [Candidatus Heimdallarchaeota archaeon]
LLTTAMTLTYSLSPIMLNKISDKLGRRKSVIISLIGAACAQLIFYVTLNPVVFLIERLFEGFILGFFFPNLLASISDNPSIDHQKYLANFNLSWSIAVVIGLIFGTVLLLFTNNLKFIFYVSPVLLLINSLIAIFLFREPVATNHGILEENISLNHQKVNNYYIPVIVPLLLILYTSFASGNGTLLYPIRSANLAFHEASTYLVNIFATTGQTIAMYIASLLVIKRLKLLSAIILLGYSFLFIFFSINRIFYLFLILFTFSGLFYGFLYGTASKLFITLNVIKKTSKYSSISESSLGVTFFISQIYLGFFADINISLAYYILSLSLLVIFFVSLIFLRKLKQIKY